MNSLFICLYKYVYQGILLDNRFNIEVVKSMFSIGLFLSAAEMCAISSSGLRYFLEEEEEEEVGRDFNIGPTISSYMALSIESSNTRDKGTEESAIIIGGLTLGTSRGLYLVGFRSFSNLGGNSFLSDIKFLNLERNKSSSLASPIYFKMSKICIGYLLM